ncbi:MAG: fibronectin type III domain-containing protein, partial [bacterium]
DQITQLQADLAAKLAEITALQAKVATMIEPEVYKTATDQIVALTAQIVVLQNELAISSSSLASSTAKIAELQAQIASLQSIITNPIDPADYQAKIKQIADLESQLAEIRKKSGGGGVLIIDKTDKLSPIITDIEATDIATSTAKITWKTSEPANGFINYSSDKTDAGYLGFPAMFTDHFFSVKNLKSGTTYDYYVSSVDGSGNLSQSVPLKLTTLALPPVIEELVVPTTTDPLIATKTEQVSPQLLESASKNIFSLLSNLSQVVSIGTFEKTLLTQFNSLDQLAKIIPSPVLSGEPLLEITPSTVTISWHTNKPSNSLVAYTPAILYSKGKGMKNYVQLAGQSDELTLDHTVKIIGLKPDTSYHYQLRSKAKIGPEASSNDFTFKTKPEALEIISYNTEIISPQLVIFRWLTSAETNTQISVIPYRNNALSVENEKSIINKISTTNHEVEVPDLESGVVYQIELSGVDIKGKKISKIIPYFSTTKDDLPPEITQIKTESALSQGKSLKVQTVISWQTNEPTISRVLYGKGVIMDEDKLPDMTEIETSYGRRHTAIITNFDPGSVYSFRIKAFDSGGNEASSNTHTILTPQQRASVFDLIIRNFESTFGWLSQVGK